MRKKFSFSFRSLGAKIIYLTCGSVFLGVFVVGALNYYRTIEIASDAAIEGLAGETRLTALRFKKGYDEMKNDVHIISRTPPIKGIIRSFYNNDIDVLDNSSTEVWRKRLETIFVSMLQDRQYYHQLRYIGVADGGREIVRVNRIGDKIETVPKKDLQQKDREPYFQTMLNGKRVFYFSKVTKNHESIESELSGVITIRAVLPILHDGKVFGMIVANIDYNEFLTEMFKEIKLSKDAFAINDKGEHIEYHKDSGDSDVHLHAPGEEDPKFLTEFYTSKEKEMMAIENNVIFYGVKLGIDENDPERFLGVMLKIPYAEVMEEVYKVRRNNIILGILIIFISLLFTFLFTVKLITPLRRMTEEIISSKNKKHLNLPIDMQDELGELARAFQKKARDLSVSEERMQTVINNIVDGIITVNEEGKIESYSDVCADIFGYKESEVLGKNLKFLLKNDSVFNKKMNSLIMDRSEAVGVAKNGNEFPLEISIGKIKLEDGVLYCCVVRDITEIKQIENLKNEFISTINHEIRTPLTSIQGSLGLLKLKEKEIKDKKTRSLIDISRSNCDRLLLLVNDILDIEKIAAGRMSYDVKHHDICRIVKDAIKKNDGYAKKYDVSFKVKDKVKRACVKVDEDRFGQAINNLLSNAVKYSPKGDEVLITIEKKGKTKVMVAVKDNGPGIPRDFYDKIFHKFSQADSKTTRKKGGTGLGLNIAKSMIESFKGEIYFESEEGKGSVFYVILPIIREKNDKK